MTPPPGPPSPAILFARLRWRAFLLLGGPILIAFGLAYGAPWYFYLLLPLFFLGFILLPGAVGALLCLLIVNCFPRRKRQMVLLGILGLVLLATWFLTQSMTSLRAGALSRDEVQVLIGRFGVAQSPLLP